VNHARRQLAAASRNRVLLNDCIADDTGEDRLRAFFESCWHVKDHAIADLPKHQHENFETTVRSVRALCLVADVANRSKHVRLTKCDRLGAAVTFKNISVSDGPLPASATYRISLADGSQVEALAAADEALPEWDRLLSQFGL
jgi:hypothetical protein